MSVTSPRKRSRGKSLRDENKEKEEFFSAETPTSPEDSNTAVNNDDLIRLDLYNSDDLINLDNLFNEFESALALQKAKLAAKWISNYTKRDPVSTPSINSPSSQSKKELLIDKKSVLKHISDIGLIKGRRFEDLEKEQNKAIQKLEDILQFEENARVSRDKAVQIQQETELEMKEIDAQRAIIANELAKAEPELVNARRAVSSISDRALTELVSLKKPPETVSKVLTVAVWIINSKVEPVKKSPKSVLKSPRVPKSTGGAIGNKKFFGDAMSPNSPNPLSPRGSSGKKVGFKDNTSSGSSNGSSKRPKSTRAGKGGRERSKSRAKEKKDILKQPWGETRKLLTSGNFKKEVLEFDPKTLAKHVCNKIETEFLTLEDFTVERANKASKVLGPLVQWIVSLVAYGKIWYKIQPMANKVAELEDALTLKTAEVEELQNISEAMHKKVIEIRGEMLVMIGYKKIGELYFLS